MCLMLKNVSYMIPPGTINPQSWGQWTGYGASLGASPTIELTSTDLEGLTQSPQAIQSKLLLHHERVPHRLGLLTKYTCAFFMISLTSRK